MYEPQVNPGKITVMRKGGISSSSKSSSSGSSIDDLINTMKGYFVQITIYNADKSNTDRRISELDDYVHSLDINKDIKDLSDSTHLREYWSGKQDQLTFQDGLENDGDVINVLYDADKIELNSNNELTFKYNYTKQLTDFTGYEATEGEIVQYIGVTDNNYTNGYVYKWMTNRWVQINVQPTSGGSSTNPIKVFSASSISSDLSNINTQILSVNDLVIISDIISGTPLTYSVNNVTKTLNGNPDFDILFRYAGNGSFKPIALPSIIN